MGCHKEFSVEDSWFGTRKLRVADLRRTHQPVCGFRATSNEPRVTPGDQSPITSHPAGLRGRGTAYGWIPSSLISRLR
jgi:hypothetical protein